jgi:3-hydroxy-4-methylanthranilate adenylyltransferase
MFSIPNTEKKALIFGKQNVRYPELHLRVQQKSEKLSLYKNQTYLKISIDLPDSFTLLEWVIAAWSAYHCVLILDQRLTEEEKQERIKRFQPDLCVQWGSNISRGISSFEGDVKDVIVPYSSLTSEDRLHEAFLHSEKIRVGDSPYNDTERFDLPALVLFTSGTTGLPKQIARTFASLRDEWDYYAQFAGAPRSSDTVLCLVPVSHSFGLISASLYTLQQGGTVIYPSSIRAQDVTQIIQDFKVTHVYGVNFHYQLLARFWRKAPPAFSNKPVFLSSGGKLDLKIIKEFKELFGFQIGQQYGMSEVGFISVDFRGDKSGSAGGISKHLKRHIDRDGQLVLHLSQSPYSENESNWEKNGMDSESGYLYTQDVINIDEAGDVFIIDRINQQVSVGGLKVNLNEIEDLLKSHPAVADCAVIARDHDVFGSQLEAFIVLNNMEAVSHIEVRSWLKEILAPHKVPRFIHTIDEIPYSSTGKKLRGKLVKECMHGVVKGS